MKNTYLEQEAREVIAPEGMSYLTVDPDISMRVINDLTKHEMRLRILEWLHQNDTVLKLNIGNTRFPATFRRNLSTVPNRGGHNAMEDTTGQCTELTSDSDFRLGIASLLAEGGHAVCDAIKQVNGGIGSVYRILKKDAGTLGTITLQMAQKANELGIWTEFVADMRLISQKSAHMKQFWKKEDNGTVLIVPESSIMHRRNGEKTGQVAWHTDTQDGTIVFCKEYGVKQPSRAIW